MRYSASEKLEIIWLVEQSSLGVRRTLQQLGIPKSTFYNWYGRYVEGGFEALEDQKPTPQAVWNKIPDIVCDKLVELALEEPELSPRELAVRFTEKQRYFLSEVVIEQWRQHYNAVRPHSSLGYRPPAPQAVLSHTPHSAPLHSGYGSIQ